MLAVGRPWRPRLPRMAPRRHCSGAPGYRRRTMRVVPANKTGVSALTPRAVPIHPRHDLRLVGCEGEAGLEAALTYRSGGSRAGPYSRPAAARVARGG